MQMLSSLVFAFLVGRLSSPTEQPVIPVHVTGRISRHFTLLELIVCSFFVITAAAVIWILGPLVVHIVHFYSPNLAAHLNLDPPKDSSPAELNWLLVKRVLLGYFALLVVCFLAFACWTVVELRFDALAKPNMSRWTIVLEETDHE